MNGSDPRASRQEHEILTAIARTTRASVENCGTPTRLLLVGDVGPVLHSTCRWEPADLGSAGSIRAVDISAAGRFGLGAAAFGAPAAEAVERLGECVLIDGNSWWTPASKSTLSRAAPPGSDALTPFLFQWDGVTSATAALRSAVPVPLGRWYQYLLRWLTEIGICETGTIAVEMVAGLPAEMISDKHLALAPLTRHRPRDRGLIVEQRHLETYFVRNAIAKAYGVGNWCTVVMAGVAIDPVQAAAAWGMEFLKRGFYETGGVVNDSAALHHTHAVVTARPPGEVTGFGAAEEAGGFVTQAIDDIVARKPQVQVTHIEADTLVSSVYARIGAVGAVKMEME
jgi:hypothetical protein